MARAASELKRSRFIKVLLMGPPKIGKTTMAVATAPKPVRCFLCESDSALHSARRYVGDNFTFERTRTHKRMLSALHEARTDVKKGRLRTIVVDPLSLLAANIEEHCLKAHNQNTYKAYPMYGRLIRQVIEQLLDLKCHVIVVTHYIETGGEMPEGTAHTGEGIVPMLAGKARATVSALFPDVVWMDYYKGKRILVTGPQGAWGPGCRSTNGTRVIPADIELDEGRIGVRALIREFRSTKN